MNPAKNRRHRPRPPLSPSTLTPSPAFSLSRLPLGSLSQEAASLLFESGGGSPRSPRNGAAVVVPVTSATLSLAFLYQHTHTHANTHRGDAVGSAALLLSISGEATASNNPAAGILIIISLYLSRSIAAAAQPPPVPTPCTSSAPSSHNFNSTHPPQRNCLEHRGGFFTLILAENSLCRKALNGVLLTVKIVCNNMDDEIGKNCIKN